MIVRHASRVVAAAASEAEPPVPVVATAEVIPFTDPRPITIATIRSAVAKYFGLTDAEILDPSPAPRFSRPRQLGMYLARRTTGHTLPVIARHFARTDHSTVIHAVREVERKLAAPSASCRAHEAVCLALLERVQATFG
jgi:chromosomal replication initiator protein